MDTEVTSQIEWGWEEGASYINLIKCVCGSRDILPATLQEKGGAFAYCEQCGRAFYASVEVRVFEADVPKKISWLFKDVLMQCATEALPIIRQTSKALLTLQRDLEQLKEQGDE